jgi:MFS family permease
VSPLTIALVATLAAQMLVSMAGNTGPVLAPLAIVDLRVGADLIGAYVALIWACAAFSGLLGGSLVAKYGPIRTSQMGLAACALGLAFTGLETSIAVMLGAVFIGLGTGPMTPASSQILARLAAPSQMNFVFSAKQTGVPLGAGLAGLIMPTIAIALSWGNATLVGAMICLACAVALQPLCARYDSARDSTRSFLASIQLFAPLRFALSVPILRRLSTLSFVYAGMQNSFAAFMVAYLHEDLGLTIVMAGFIFTVGQIAGAIGRLVWAGVADRLIGAQRLLGWLGIAMAACAILTAAFTPDWSIPLILVVSIAFGGTSIAWNGIYLAQVARNAPEGRISEATGATAFCTFVGIVTIPALFGVILSLTGSYALGFIVVAAMTATVGIWLLVTEKRGNA